MHFLLKSLMPLFLPVFVIVLLNRFTLVECNFCLEDKLNIDGEDLMFTKELSNVEFGIGRQSKALHCCATNYKAILWFKGDKLYPWKDGESNFILDPISNNQTLYVNSLAKQDAGTYSCYIMGNSLYRSRHIPLTVFEIDYTGIPKKTYIPPARESVDVDGTARLYCETFVGKIDLPDAESKIKWYKLTNGRRVPFPDENDPRVSVKKVIRDAGQTIGMYLIIERVDPTDSGQYVCIVSNTDDQIIEMQSEIVVVENIFSLSEKQKLLVFITVSTLVVLMILISFIYLKYRYQFQLYIRKCINTEKNDRIMQHDLFIFYEPRKIDFLNEYLVPKLVNDRYKVTKHVLKARSAITMECQCRIAISRKVLVVLSTEDVNNQQSQKHFSQKLYLLSSLPTQVICLLVVETAESLTAECRSWLNSMTAVKVIVWTMYKNDHTNMWRALRVYLPIINKPEKEDHFCDDRRILYSMY